MRETPQIHRHERLEGARGGGHEMAVGAQVKIDDLDAFKKKIFSLVDVKN